MKYHVCSEQDIQPGNKRTYTVKNVPVVVVRSNNGEFHAIYGFCPHQHSPLGEGVLVGVTEAAQPGDTLGYQRVGEILRCPWHGFSFDVVTGRCLSVPDKLRVRTYPLTVDEHEVFIEM